ncbi:phage terminase large subunit [uncultured Enterovirga sp.]|uniref:phage terminase large subunit n=1 Tax=uncultured Enterovirga sp. TaxID=2026352 RepID=UPI0035CC10DE
MNARFLDAVIRTDFVSFIEKCMGTLAPATPLMRNWHIQAIAHHLELCRLGHVRRLIVTVPPRHLKSVCSSVAFVAWLLGHDPSAKIMGVSYNADIAAMFARDTRTVMEEEWYRRLFPNTRLSRRRSADMDFVTTKRGGRYAASTGGPLTGRGAGFIIIDDPIKADDILSDVMRERPIRWFRETLITRLDDKRNDVIILVMQRLHIDDLVGHLLPTGEWLHLDLPAIAQEDQRILIGPDQSHLRLRGSLLHPEREPLEVLARIERDMGARAFAAQYLQRPTAPEGAIIHWSWFGSYDRLGDLRPTDEIVQSWDTASKTAITNDYSVCTTWLIREDRFHLLDVYRARLAYPDLRRKVIALAKEFGANYVLIEDTSSGQHLIQEFQRERPDGVDWYEVTAITPVKDKVERAEAASVAIEQGRVLLRAGAAYLEELRAEIVAFPRGTDDQVDSITQFLAWTMARVTYVGHINQTFVH